MTGETDEPPILARFNDGRQVPVQPCDCGDCGNEFFVPAYSAEWMPRFCPYCGIRFRRVVRDGEEIDHRPADRHTTKGETHPMSIRKEFRFNESVPTIVCLCGSTRFRSEFEAANRRETLLGKVVLSVGMFGHGEGIDMDGPIKAMLDRLHFRKIELADEILVLDVGGYIGTSTRNEINHATAIGKPIRYLSTEAR